MIMPNTQPNRKSAFLLSSICLFFVLIMTACESTNNKTDKIGADTTAMKVDTVKQFDIALVDNKKDPSCGMPVSAGIGDTAHYKNKVLGFCSAECKAEFVKNPEAMLAAAEMKK
jgi:YHS domain-containing protein